MRVPGGAADEIELVIHSINEENVNVAWFSVHDLVSGRTTAAIAVRRPVFDTEIRLDLNDDPGNASATLIWNDKQLSQKPAGYASCVLARKEIERDLLAQGFRHLER